MFLQRMHLGLNEGGLFSHEMRQMKGKGGFWRNNKLQHKGECGQNACRYYHPSHDRGCFSMQILASPFKHIRFNITLPILPWPFYEIVLLLHECLPTWHERVLKHYHTGRPHYRTLCTWCHIILVHWWK